MCLGGSGVLPGRPPRGRAVVVVWRRDWVRRLGGVGRGGMDKLVAKLVDKLAEEKGEGEGRRRRATRLSRRRQCQRRS